MLTEEVVRNRADWKKWVMGPYRLLLQSETYKRDVEDWEVGNHEFLAEKDASEVARCRDLAKVAWHRYKNLGAVSWGHQGGKLRALLVWGTFGKHHRDGHCHQRCTSPGLWDIMGGLPEMSRYGWYRQHPCGQRMRGP